MVPATPVRAQVLAEVRQLKPLKAQAPIVVRVHSFVFKHWIRMLPREPPVGNRRPDGERNDEKLPKDSHGTPDLLFPNATPRFGEESTVFRTRTDPRSSASYLLLGPAPSSLSGGGPSAVFVAAH
jgi:hypothetical protein